MNIITVCKNVIASNNKRGWKCPDPAIRVAKSKSGKAVDRGHEVAIKDAAGNTVAVIVSSTDGNAILKCGAKVAIFTSFPAQVIS